jgi:mannose-1-phosphate guanylyltransferase
MAASADPCPDLVAVIMAGGAGTRFWPLSTEARPKQLLTLVGERSLLQQSLDRLAGLVAPERVLVLTSSRLVPAIREQLPEVPPDNVIGEPCRRDTAAAVCLGALLARARWGDPVVLTVTADHLIAPVAELQRCARSAARAARATGALYTFSIPPTYPATGYGYLELGDGAGSDDGVEHFRILRFHEKPGVEKAREYLASGRFGWNSGMFCWTASAVLGELARQLPEHLERIGEAVTADGTPELAARLAVAFAPLTPVSVDFGVMERAADVRCVAARFEWSDVGGWLALRELMEADADGNRVRGRLHALDARGNLVFCESPGETVLLAGVEDLVVVRAGGRTLVARADRLEEIKAVVQRIAAEG